MEGYRYWSFGFLPIFGFLVFGLGDLTGPWTTVSAESAASSSTLTLRFYPLDLEGVLTIVAVSLWGLIILFVVSALIYALIRRCISIRNEANPGDGDDTRHLTSQRHSTDGKNEVSTYYVYINAADAPNTESNTEPNTNENGNRMSSTIDISVQTYGAI
ncbi:uncharacterized protein LOC119746386 isoform X2 [Patiria miniata]|uniref:Uncharacterized protein n=1 Tax=Patiria miniata TaxID=46514 RepID=A0A914BSS2_PATMI|nr:uncharacterized protein LOC119746386 isoform X2 [Patiria miniata]